MPLYTFTCPVAGCKRAEEVLCKHADLGTAWAMCPDHDKKLVWQGVERPQRADMTGNRGGSFKLKAITQAGAKIPVTNGRSSRMPRRK